MFFSSGFKFRSIQLLIQDAILQSQSILDLGSGIGDYLKYTNENQRVVAVEPSPKYCEVVRKRVPWVNVVNIDGITFLENTEEKFDCILLLDVAEHLFEEDAIKLVKLAKSHSKNIVIIQTPFGIHKQDHDPWGHEEHSLQTHRTTWTYNNIHKLELSFFSIWEDFCTWNDTEDKSPDIVIGMWLKDYNEFNILVDAVHDINNLRDTLDSIKKQSYPCFKSVVFVNNLNGSLLDEVIKQVKSDSRFQYLSVFEEEKINKLKEGLFYSGGASTVIIDSGEKLDHNELMQRRVEQNRQRLLVSGNINEFFSQSSTLQENTYISKIESQNKLMWNFAFKEGYTSSMGDHDNYPYKKFLEDLGFYDDLKNSGKIAEFGCGPGDYAEKLVKEFPNKEFYLYEISDKILEELRIRFKDRKNVHLILNNHSSSIADEISLSFSFLLCQSMPRVLWVKHLAYINKILGHEGAYVFQFRYANDLKATDSILEGISGVNSYSPIEMNDMLNSAGFNKTYFSDPFKLSGFREEDYWFICKTIKE